MGAAAAPAARRLNIPLRTIEPEPWSLGIRFQEEPEGLHRSLVAPGAAADNTPISDLPLPEDAWISFVIREGRLEPALSDTALHAGNEVVMLTEGTDEVGLREIFS